MNPPRKAPAETAPKNGEPSPAGLKVAPVEEDLPANEVILALPYDMEHRGFNVKAKSALQCTANSPGITFDQTEIAFILDISHQRVSIMEKHGLERLLKKGKTELEAHLSD